ncbi:Damage response protein 1, partial [Tolypocladium capitatum]
LVILHRKCVRRTDSLPCSSSARSASTDRPTDHLCQLQRHKLSISISTSISLRIFTRSTPGSRRATKMDHEYLGRVAEEAARAAFLTPLNLILASVLAYTIYTSFIRTAPPPALHGPPPPV